MRLVSEALTNAKRRRALVERNAAHTKRKIWEEELGHIEYTIRFLRGEISLHNKPFAKEAASGMAVRPDLLMRGRRQGGDSGDMD